MLNFESFEPKVLTKYIESFDYYCCNEHIVGEFSHLLLPTGKVHLLFQFDTLVEHNTAFTNGWQSRPDVCVGGPFDKAYEMKLNVSSRIFSVTFKPSMAKYFIPVPISALSNELAHPYDIWGKESEDMIDKLQEANSNRRRVWIMEEFLLKKLIDIKSSSIEDSCSRITINSGLGKTEQYAQMANLSLSRFRQKFTDEIGFSPKVFQRLTKVNAISKFYQKNPSTSFTSLAHQFDYFDQSHFIKDFKSITGFTPLQYFQNRRFLLF